MSARVQLPARATSAASRLSLSRPRIAFVGLGWIGRKRLDALASESSEGFDVAVLVDSDTDHLRAAALAHPQASVAPTIDALFDEDIDAVVIATPNGLHAAQTIACLERGLAVFCQKPLATTLHDVRRVLAAARAADRLLGIDFCYRHISGMHELRRRLLSGAIGEVVAIDLTFHNAYGPDKSWCRDRALAGGGCLLDLGVHLLDLALWVQGAPLLERVRSRLFANGQPLQGVDGALEDLAYAEFIQPNGAIVRLGCSWHAHIGQPARIQMEITGTRGGASWCNVDGSFFDFDVHWFEGTKRERLGMSRDDWGTRALGAWLQRLRTSNRFDPEAEHIVRSASLIEEVYRA